MLNYHFFSYDLDHEPMTLILKLYLDMVKMYLHTKNEISMSRGSKVIALTDRNTDRQKDTHTHTQRHDRKHYLPAYAGGSERQTGILEMQAVVSRRPRLLSNYRQSPPFMSLPTLTGVCVQILRSTINITY